MMVANNDKRSGQQLGLLGDRYDGGFGNHQGSLPLDTGEPAQSPLDQAVQAEQATHQEPGDELFGPVISSYTREQAINDGVLIDVTDTKERKKSGIKYPLALTSAAYAQAVEVPDPDDGHGQSIEGRLWDVCTMFVYAVKHNYEQDDPLMRFALTVWNGTEHEKIVLKANIGPGDNGEPVITIMQPHED